jgi:ribosomal protein L33
MTSAVSKCSENDVISVYKCHEDDVNMYLTKYNEKQNGDKMQTLNVAEWRQQYT